MSELQDFFQNQEEEETIQIKDLLMKYFIYWPWYILSILLFLILGIIYLKYQPNIYEARASVLVKKDKGGLLSDMGNIGDMFSQKDQIEDEIELMKSLPVLVNATKTLNLNVIYYRKSSLSKKLNELYVDSPYKVDVFFKTDNHQSYNFLIKHLNATTFSLENTDLENKNTYQYNQRIPLDDNTTIVVKTNPENKSYLNDNIYISIKTVEKAALDLINELKIESSSKQSSAINLSLKSSSLAKAKDVLNEVIDQYFKNTVQDKKTTISNTADFVKDRVILLDSELKQIEGEIKLFKQKNKLTDLVTEAGIYSENVEKSNQKVFEAELQLNLVNALNQKLKQNTYVTLPVNQGLGDQAINASIAKYNELVLNIKNLTSSTTEYNPERILLDKQIKEAKKSIVEGLNNQQKTLQITLDNVKKESNLLDSKLRSVPLQEKEMREITRQHQTKEALFLYLLQKREELAISETSLEPNARLINYAYGLLQPVSPKKNILYLVFLIIGFAIPTVIIYIKYLLDSKIHTTEYLEKKSWIPNIGIIPKFNDQNRTLLTIDDRSSTSEALRLVLTNCEFILAENIGCKTILTTSTIAGEGKSFISANMASFFAFSGKKVILLGFDLRAPKLHEFFNYNNINGITHFVKNKEVTIQEIITPIAGYDSLDIIHSGVTVPNFVELMKNSKIEELFSYLKNNYDYIIIDSAPVGLVSDTLNLSKYADMCLYVVKAHYLDKKMLSISNKLFKDKKFKEMKSILNAVDVKKSAYGYGYGYGQSSYGYGIENHHKLENYKFKPWKIEFYKYWFKF